VLSPEQLQTLILSQLGEEELSAFIVGLFVNMENDDIMQRTLDDLVAWNK